MVPAGGAAATAMPADDPMTRVVPQETTTEGSSEPHVAPGRQTGAVDLYAQGLNFADVAPEHRVAARHVQTSPSSSDLAVHGHY